MLISIYRHKEDRRGLTSIQAMFYEDPFAATKFKNGAQIWLISSFGVPAPARGKREKNEGGLMNINDELNKQF